jgi:hypothetical protein
MYYEEFMDLVLISHITVREAFAHVPEEIMMKTAIRSMRDATLIW